MLSYRSIFPLTIKVSATQNADEKTEYFQNRAIHSGLKLYENDSFNSQTEISFPRARERVNERASEQISLAERASKARFFCVDIFKNRLAAC